MKRTYLTMLLLLSTWQVYGQTAVAAAGAEGQGPGGTVSLTIGQVFYHTYYGGEISVAEGVQQAYEISVTVGRDIAGLDLSVAVYPNPTRQMLHLETDLSLYEDLHWQLFDLAGTLLRENSIAENRSVLDLSELPAATYLLRVRQENRLFKTFKIIKLPH